ncbi:MAG TPA: GNAT family protein [Anaerolineales bacterium]|nr:GNAT family protein [Anaerolineales bacterium]
MLATTLPNCILRPWQKNDVASLVSHANNHKVWRNLTDNFPHPYTQANAQFWVQYASQPIGKSLHLAIVVDGQAVGGIGVDGQAGIYQKTGLFGYWLGERYWGQGIATSAARALVLHLAQINWFVRLEANVFAWNPASMRVLQKAGFRQVGCQRQSVFKDNALTDSVLFEYLFGEITA